MARDMSAPARDTGTGKLDDASLRNALLQIASSLGVMATNSGIAAGGNLCVHYVAQATAVATGVGPYTLPHVPGGDAGTDGSGNLYHKVFVLHGAAPQNPAQISLLNGDQLTLAFAPTQALFVIFCW